MPRGVKRNNDKLTKAQEVFVNAILQGLSQRQAYLKAYPLKRKWAESSVDVEASKLMKQPKVVQRYEELMRTMRQEEQDKTKWTREESIRTLRSVIDVNLKEVERINQAAEEELEEILNLIKVDPNNAQKYVRGALKMRQMRRLSGVHNGGIVAAVAELNKMQGFNEETINLNGAVVFSGMDDLED